MMTKDVIRHVNERHVQTSGPGCHHFLSSKIYLLRTRMEVLLNIDIKYNKLTTKGFRADGIHSKDNKMIFVGRVPKRWNWDNCKTQSTQKHQPQRDTECPTKG